MEKSKNQNSIPKVVRSAKIDLNYQKRLKGWLSLIRNAVNKFKGKQVDILSTKEEVSSMTTDNVVFIINYFVYVNGHDTNYGLIFYFEPFDKTCIQLMDYREDSSEFVDFKTKGTPFALWDDPEKLDKVGISCITSMNWEEAYNFFVDCLNFFSNFVPGLSKQDN